MVPTALAMAAILSGLAISLTAVIATVRVLGSRITDVRDDMTGLRTDVRADMTELRGEIGGLRSEFSTRFDDVTEQLTTVRASLGAIDARLTTLEQQR